MLRERCFVAGHRGLAGSSIVRALERQGHLDIVCAARDRLDLREQAAVREFFDEVRPSNVVLAAAKVGGIVANSSMPADFILENLQIQTNVIAAALAFDVKKLVFLGSSCIYPKMAPQPLDEEALMSGPLEPTNAPYAVAKIAGITLCESIAQQHHRAFVSLMPTNLYGPNDNYHAENSHVIPGLIRRFHEAKSRQARVIKVWGTGTPLREFMHVDDLAEAVVTVLHSDMTSGHLNVGSGQEISIRELTTMIAQIVGYTGRIEWDVSRPDGTPRKLLDCSKMRALGWLPRVPLRQGLEAAYRDFQADVAKHKITGGVLNAAPELRSSRT